MIHRVALERGVRKALGRAPVVALLGPRQCGKTTLAKQLAGATRADYFDLESPVDRERLATPALALQPLRGLVVIDEIQRQPQLFELLRVLSDRPRTPARFLVLGSASAYLARGMSESLAGRIEFVEMGGFHLSEAAPEAFERLWLRGGFPRAYLAPSDCRSLIWRDQFTRTFLERDIPQLGIGVPSETLRRFWTMVAHYHAQIWSAAEFARSLGSSEPTARRYLDILSGAYVVRQLQPWFENISKRQVKSPKVYIRDSGLLHTLLGLRTFRQLTCHPKLGASWEGFTIEQILLLSSPREAYFWATHEGAELDLLVFRNGRRVGFEMKLTDAPAMTRSIGPCTKPASTRTTTARRRARPVRELRGVPPPNLLACGWRADRSKKSEIHRNPWKTRLHENPHPI